MKYVHTYILLRKKTCLILHIKFFVDKTYLRCIQALKMLKEYSLNKLLIFR